MSTKEGTPTQKPQFSEQDSEKIVEFLNFVAQKAKFQELEVKEVIRLTRLLNWFQTDLLPKIDAHRFEILSIKKAKK